MAKAVKMSAGAVAKAVLIGLCMLGLCLIVTPFRASANEGDLDPNIWYGHSTEEGKLTYYVYASDLEKISSMTFSVGFDSQNLKFDSYETGSCLGGSLVSVNDNGNTVTMAIASAGGFNVKGEEFVRLTFDILFEGEEGTSVTFTNAVLECVDTQLRDVAVRTDEVLSWGIENSPSSYYYLNLECPYGVAYNEVQTVGVSFYRNAGFYSGSFMLTYDPAELQFQSASGSPSSGVIVSATIVEEGQVKVAFASPSLFTKRSDFIDIDFVPLQAGTWAYYNVHDLSISNGNLDEVTFNNWYNGYIYANDSEGANYFKLSAPPSASYNESIDVRVDLCNNTGFGALGATLEYDTNVFSFVKCSYEDGILGGALANVDTSKPGKVKIAAVSASDLTASGALITVELKAKAPADEVTGIGFTVGEFADSSARNVSHSAGAAQVRVFGPECEHEWGNPQFAWGDDYSTCMVTYTCQKNTEHVLSETCEVMVAETPATCTATGNRTYTVVVAKSGRSFTDQRVVDVPALGHVPGSPTHENEVAATCESAGSYDLVTRCTVCNEVLETKTVNVEALGHTWNNGAVTKAPTCTEPGTRTYTCARDASHTRTEAVPATGHIAGEPAHENEAPATCTDAGSYDLVTRCTSCGELLSSEHVAVPATGHKWGEYVPDGNATCESDGTKTAQCVNGCGASDTVDDVGSALGHDWDEGTVTKQPTCTAEGVMTYACKRDKSHTRAEAVPATGHVPGGPAPENVAPATCESAGSHDLVTRCSACGELLSSEHVTVPALGHDWDEGAVAKAPTCTEAGVKTFTCKNDPSHKRDEAIPATGHEWGAGVVTRQPTATEEGVRTYTCATCGQTREEAVPKAQPTDISAAEVSGLADAVYTGKAVEPDPRVTLGGATLVRGVDYALSYKGNVNAGTATVTVTGIGNYAGTKAAIFKIAPKKATPTVTLSKASYVYDGSAKKPSVTVKVGGTKLSSSSYTVAYASGRKAVGTYKVTVKLKGNYTGTKAVTFKITPKKATPTVTLSKTSYAYDGKAKKPSVTVKVGKTKLSSSSYTVTYASGRKAVGTYKVTVKLKGNYAGTKAATFKVTQAANTATAKKTSVSASFTVAQLKSKAQTVALPGVTAKFGTAKWKVTAKDAKGVLSLKSGKVQVKKGAKAGAYTIKLKASVAATKNYKAASTKVVTVKVTVKAKASTALKAQSDGTALAAGTMAL